MTFTPTQSQHYGYASPVNQVLSFKQPSTAGTFLVVCIETDQSGGPSPATPSGWSVLPVKGTNSGNTAIVTNMFYYPSNPGGLTGFEVMGSFSFATAVMGEFPGVGSTLDAYGVVAGTGEAITSLPVTASSSNSGAGDLVITFYGAAGELASPGSETVSISSSTPTLTALDAETDGFDFGVSSVFYGSSGAIGETDTATPTFSHTDYWSGLIATFLTAPSFKTFTPPLAYVVPPFLPETRGPEYGLTKYMASRGAGVAVFKLSNGKYVQTDPTTENSNTAIPAWPLMPDQTNPNIINVDYTGATPGNPPTRTETDVNPYVITVYYGGRNYTVSMAEATALTAAGYGDCIH